MSTKFSLRFDAVEIAEWASRYSYEDDSQLEQEIGPRSRAQGYLTREDFLTLCRWKSARPQKHCEHNSETDVRAVTAIALSTKDEKLRIDVLTALRGVEMRTASAILHFTAVDRYPIIDVRALWSLGVEAPNWYGFGLWWSYTEFCRELADNAHVSMRTLDRALWQFSNVHQKSATFERPLSK
ncbi:MAG TPA: hypothetical protein VFE47_03220 [Tepidisphaeraceae bacterium]|nr:hypothetical protein [Tepidisphaeraceae bacterium]